MHCAAAKSLRHAFILCDFCCQLYGIRPREGYHVPWGVHIPDEEDDLLPLAAGSNLALTASSANVTASSADTSFLDRQEMPPRTTVMDGELAGGGAKAKKAGKKVSRARDDEGDPAAEAYERMQERPGVRHPMEGLVKASKEFPGLWEFKEPREVKHILVEEGGMANRSDVSFMTTCTFSLELFC